MPRGRPKGMAEKTRAKRRDALNKRLDDARKERDKGLSLVAHAKELIASGKEKVNPRTVRASYLLLADAYRQVKRGDCKCVALKKKLSELS
jgi:hypothetical protein